ncbi:unnamed protein product [Rhizophagus irregularis]|nr:unnamed protein product [Rhizophagus irregularis]
MKTKDFMENYMTIKELNDEEIIGELRKWYGMNAMECPLCNKMLLKKKAVEYNGEYFTGRICESCFEKEKNINNGTEIEKRLKQLKKLMETSEVNITDEELLRLIELEYKDIDILDEEFIELFQRNRNETDKKLKSILDEHLGIFDEEESNDKEIESRMMKIKETCKRMEIEITEGEILRILRMGYSNKEILSWGFIKLFQENKNELEGVIKEILDKYLRKQIEIEKNDEKEDSEDELGEILSPEEYEIWEEDTRNFDEDEFENVINTDDFDSSQNSDSNNSLNIKDSDTESEISDYNLQDLFQENILLNMATIDDVRGIIRTFVQNQYGNDLGADLGNANPNLVNNTLGNLNATRGLIVEFPLFGGSENEDAEEWVQRFIDAYATNALADDNVNRFRIAKGCLVGTARDWLRTEGANIDNWGGGNINTSLDRRIVSKYASDEIKERWQDELENIKQGDKESVTSTGRN